MRFIDVDVQGRLVLGLTDRPRPAAGEVLVKVTASGLNRADILQRQGKYPPPPGASSILGLEVSGTIEELGPECAHWQVGDQVCALLAGGGYAEYCAVPEGHCLPVPNGITVTDAAALPEAVFTVWANLFSPPMLAPGDTILIQGGSSGIGTMAIQTAKAHGCRVLTTAGSDEKCQRCLDLGADEAFNYRKGDEWSRSHADVVLDMVGGEYFERHLALLNERGRLVCIASSRGRQATLDISMMMRKRLHLTGSTLRGRPIQEKNQLAHEVRSSVWPLIEAGKVRPVVDSVFKAEDAQEAHERMEASVHIGKILLAW